VSTPVSQGESERGRRTLHEGSDGNRADDLHGLVDPGQDTELAKGRATSEAVGREGND
jgi:hypothetical protein